MPSILEASKLKGKNMNHENLTSLERANVRPREVYEHQEYPKMCMHPEFPDDPTKSVRCETADDQINFYYGFTEEGAKIVEAKKEADEKLISEQTAKESKIKEVRAAAIKNSIAKAKKAIEEEKNKAKENIKKGKKPKDEVDLFA